MKKIFKKQLSGKRTKSVDYTDAVSPAEIKKGRTAAALGYVCFLIPLILREDNSFAMFHCNQSMLNLILSTVVPALMLCIPVAGVFLAVLQEVLCLVFLIRGIRSALMGKAVEIPVVGWLTIMPYRYA